MGKKIKTTIIFEIYTTFNELYYMDGMWHGNLRTTKVHCRDVSDGIVIIYASLEDEKQNNVRKH